MALRSIAETLYGVIPALPTPLTQNREVDVQGLETLIRHVLDGGVHGLWVLGSTGEFATLSPEERRLIVEVTVKEARGRVPVIVGLGANDIRKVISNAEEAQLIGADACFLLLPFYFVVNAQEAVRYFQEIADAVPLPVILYDNPFTTKVRLDTNAFLELSDHPKIIAVKDSSSDFIRFQNLIVNLREKTSWRLLQGDERLVGSSLLWGADGCVVALASIAPTLFVELYETAKKGDGESTLALQRQVLSLCKLFELKGEATDGAFFAGMKAALQVLGICGRAVSSPFSAMPENKMAAVEKILQHCQLAPSAGGEETKGMLH